MNTQRIRDFANVFSGYAFSSNDLVEEGIPVLKIGNIQNGNVLKDCSDYYNQELSEKLNKYVLQPNDFLIAMTGAGSVGRAGRMQQSDSKEIYLVNQRVAIVRPKANSNGVFLYAFFRLPHIEQYLYSLGIGAGQPNISAKDILQTKVLFPNKTNQDRIADILSKYDELIEVNNQRIKKLEQTAEELYKEWFVRFRFPNYQNTEFENGIPKGWLIKRLSDFGRVETGKTPSTENSDNYGEKYMFVKTPDMHENTFVIQTEEMLSEIGNRSQPKKLLPSNSIMVSCIGTAGVVAITTKPSHTNQQINSIILNDLSELEWMYQTCVSLRPSIVAFGATGATMTNLSKGKFERLKVIYPTRELVNEYHVLTQPIFDRIKTLLYCNQNLVKQRDLLLPRLMSGKLEV